MTKPLILFSTQGCHLCEMAFSQIESLNLSSLVEVVDIAFDDELFSRYGVTIPVLAIIKQDELEQDSKGFKANVSHEALQVELFWPFDIEKLQTWLKQNGINYHT
ncbi:MAG: glutaredoxin family protein [Vibrio sp.]